MRIVDGRKFRSDRSKIVVNQPTAKSFRGAAIRQQLCVAGRDWQVVDCFGAGGTGSDSEVWSDAKQVPQVARHGVLAVPRVRLTDACLIAAADPLLMLKADLEVQCYVQQIEALATSIRILGLALTINFSIGAVVGAMITMFAIKTLCASEFWTPCAMNFRRAGCLRLC